MELHIIDGNCFIHYRDIITYCIGFSADRDMPKAPIPTEIKTDEEHIMLSLNHSKICFTSHTFRPEVHLNGSLVNVAENFNEMFVIGGLEVATTYSITVFAVSEEDSSIRSEPYNAIITTNEAGGAGTTSRLSLIFCCVQLVFCLITF